jgi:hypothetical protein
VSPTFLKRLPGTSTRSCVDATGQTDLRSGEIVAGNFAAFADDMRSRRGSKLYWIPLHQQLLDVTNRQPTRLLVWGKRLDGAESYFQEHSVVATSGGELFFPTGPKLPTLGRWRLMAATGPDWACFDIAL